MTRGKQVHPRREENLERLWFGQVLARLRKSQSLTQEQLAEASGYSSNYISLLECGDRSPTLTALFRLAPPLGVAASEMVSAVEVRKRKT